MPTCLCSFIFIDSEYGRKSVSGEACWIHHTFVYIFHYKFSPPSPYHRQFTMLGSRHLLKDYTILSSPSALQQHRHWKAYRRLDNNNSSLGNCMSYLIHSQKGKVSAMGMRECIVSQQFTCAFRERLSRRLKGWRMFFPRKLRHAW